MHCCARYTIISAVPTERCIIKHCPTMKGTDCFKSTLRTYLEYRAGTDELFAVRYANPQKNLDDCVTYILNEVQRSECNGFADDEIYSNYRNE